MNESSLKTRQYEKLFSPITVGPMTVKNRICETSNSPGSSRSTSNGLIDEHNIEFHVSKARGGFGWIGGETWILNSLFPDCAEDELNHYGFYSGRVMPYMLPGYLESARRYIDEVHKAGAVAVIQFTHLHATVGASAVPASDAINMVPHPMREEHIEFFIQTYVTAAEMARDAGADGVEISCSHENIPQTFLSPATNKRTDKWGGDAEGRTLFLREVLRRVREVIGDNMALGFRINGMEARQGGYDLMELREMVYIIAETGLINYVSVDVGHSWTRHSYVPPSFYAPAENREAGLALRTDLDEKIKIIFTGRINEPIVAEELLQSGVCDLVGMTRAGIADPEFPNKIKEGRLLEMRRCIACNRCIHESVESTKPDFFKKPVCSVNPSSGNEVMWNEMFKPAAVKKHVVVIGAGPAGLEAARVSASRGHRVTIIEKGKRVGGQMLLASRAPGRDSFEDFIYFQENEIERLGITLMLETEATVDMIKGLNADVVVCATGSVQRVPLEATGLDRDNVVMGWDVLLGKAGLGDRVVVYSEEDYFETPNIAESIAAKGKKTTILHKWNHIGKEIDKYSMGAIMQRMEENHIDIVCGVRLKHVGDNRLELISAYTGAERSYEGFDSLVIVCGSVPSADLYYELRDTGSFEKVYLAGSAWNPRRISNATQQGSKIGLEI